MDPWDWLGIFLTVALTIVGIVLFVSGVHNAIAGTTNSIDVTARIVFGLAILLGCGRSILKKHLEV